MYLLTQSRAVAGICSATGTAESLGAGFATKERAQTCISLDPIFLCPWCNKWECATAWRQTDGGRVSGCDCCNSLKVSQHNFIIAQRSKQAQLEYGAEITPMLSVSSQAGESHHAEGMFPILVSLSLPFFFFLLYSLRRKKKGKIKLKEMWKMGTW